MNINDLTALIEIYDSYEEADKILMIATGSDYNSVLECNKGLFGNYKKLEGIILRNALPESTDRNTTQLQLLADRNLSALTRASRLLGHK